MFAPKCNQDQMLTTISPPFILIHAFIYAYMYILHLLMITQLVSTGLQMIHFWIRSSQWTHTFSKCLCAFFYLEQLLKLNNYDLLLDQIITITWRPSKLTHNFTNPYILQWLIDTYLIELNLLHMMHFWIKSSKWQQTLFSQCLYMYSCFFRKQLHFISNVTSGKFSERCNPLFSWIKWHFNNAFMHIPMHTDFIT